MRVRSPDGARVVWLLRALLIRPRVRRQQSLRIAGAIQCHECPHFDAVKCAILWCPGMNIIVQYMNIPRR